MSRKVSEIVSSRIGNTITNINTWSGILYNVKSYSATGDGVTDDTSAIQTAIDAAALVGGGIVYISRGRFKLTTLLNIPSNVVLEGAGIGITILDFSTMAAGTTLTDAKGISLAGSVGTAISVTTVIVESSNQIIVSDASSLSADDLILLTNGELYDPLTDNITWTKSEILRIKSIASNTITTYDETLFGYALSNAQVKKMTPVENVVIKNLSIEMGGVGSAHNGIYVDKAYNVTVDNVFINKAESVGVTFDYVYLGVVKNSIIEKSTSPGGAIGNTGYGALADNSTRHITFSQNFFRQCRHSVAGGNMANDVLITENHSVGSTDRAYDAHEPCFYWTFADNHSTSDAGGFNLRGQYMTAIGNTIVSPSSVGIFARSFTPVTSQNGIRIIGNMIHNGTSNGIQADGPNGKQKDLQIIGNEIEDCVFTGIIVQHFEGAQVSDNTVKTITGTNSDGISILGASGNLSKDLMATDNKVNGVNRYGFRIEFVDEVTLGNPIAKECINLGIRILDCIAVSINGGYAYNNGFNSIIVQNTIGLIIDGFKAYITSQATGVGIRVATCSDIIIVNCIVKNNTSNAIYVSGTDYVIVKNNIVRENTAATKVNIDASAVTNIVSDNIIA